MLDTAARDEAVARLVAEELVESESGEVRATRRWRGAIARAAARLVETDDERADLRVPIADALLEIYGPDVPDELLADMIEVLLPIEATGVEPLEPGPLSIPHPSMR